MPDFCCSATSAQHELQPIPAPEEQWYLCGIDIVLQYVPTSFGFQLILVIVCYLSEFLIERPLETKTSREVLDRLQKITLLLVCPKPSNMIKELYSQARNVLM